MLKIHIIHCLDVKDTRAGKVAVEGWAETSKRGLACLDDIRALLQRQYAKLEGAITGRALCDGRLDARAARALLSGADA